MFFRRFDALYLEKAHLLREAVRIVGSTVTS